MVKLLVQNNANLQIYNGTPLKTSVNHKNYKMTEILLLGGANPTQSTSAALRTAVGMNDLKLTKLLLDNGALKTDIRRWNDVKGEMAELLDLYEDENFSGLIDA